MGTRSDIIVHLKDGKWKRVYCHFDGYISHNGQILFDHYNTQELAEAVVAPGDLSVLAKNCSKPKGHTFDKPVEGYCIYYKRDRGEKEAVGTVGDSLAKVWPEEGTWTEFTYVWDNGKWYVGDPDKGTQTLSELADVITGKVVLTPYIKAPWGIIGQHSGKV